jgi:glycosyltransferase involved in cell wall biosynthesis
MENTRLVSIVLPTHNGSRYISQSINSCIEQTYPHWELIIVNDASTDETPEIIERFARQDPRIHVVHHEENRRLPAALNTGFAQAKGDYFSWTSDDNLYHPEALEEMVRVLDSSPDVDFVYTDITHIDENGEFIRHVPARPPEMLIVEDAVGACFLYRREVHEALNGYDEDLFLAEDMDFFLRATFAFKLQPLPKNLYSYRRHKDSLSSTQSQRIYRVHEDTVRRVISQVDVSRDIKSLAYIRLAKRAFNHRDFVSVIKYSLMAVWHSPLYIIKRIGDKLLKR